MREVFKKVIYIVFVTLFSLPSTFTAVQSRTAQQHADAIINPHGGGIAYTNATAITNVQVRKDRFFTHIVDQHFGLNPNS